MQGGGLGEDLGYGSEGSYSRQEGGSRNEARVAGIMRMHGGGGSGCSAGYSGQKDVFWFACFSSRACKLGRAAEVRARVGSEGGEELRRDGGG